VLRNYYYCDEPWENSRAVEFRHLFMLLIQVRYGIFFYRDCLCVRVNITLRCFRVTIVAVETPVLHILSVCLQPYLSSLHSACAMLSSVACPAIQYVFTLSYKRRDFREKVIGNKMCFDFLSNSFLKRFSL